mmetsp:Transcript_21143/g.58624  ORF Transcript_21143/g.58624 Transcript_21143/m.58624 type:complete len:117 (+) Transcript_21143:1334-1684(+)
MGVLKPVLQRSCNACQLLEADVAMEALEHAVGGGATVAAEDGRRAEEWEAPEERASFEERTGVEGPVRTLHSPKSTKFTIFNGLSRELLELLRSMLARSRSWPVNIWKPSPSESLL